MFFSSHLVLASFYTHPFILKSFSYMKPFYLVEEQSVAIEWGALEIFCEITCWLQIEQRTMLTTIYNYLIFLIVPSILYHMQGTIPCFTKFLSISHFLTLTFSTFSPTIFLLLSMLI